MFRGNRIDPVSLRRVLVLLTLALSLLTVAAATAGDLDPTFHIDAKNLAINNLVGEVTVTGTAGDEFVVQARVRGDDAEPGLIDFVLDEGRKSSLNVVFPVDQTHKFVYPELGRGSSTTFSYRTDENGDHDRSWLKKIFSGMSGDRIKVSGRGSGLEVWVDLHIEVPAGAALTVKNGVGRASAANVEGDLVLDTSSGSVEVESIRGSLLVDTGSGSVQVSDVRGDVLVDTGSGSVTINSVRGELNIDTGSGRVQARRIESDSAKIDTGSGSVVLELDRIGSGEFVIDTGSGSVQLVLPNDASARIQADTGSGGVKNKVTDAQIRHQERDELDMIIGNGDARVMIDTGSGSVTITRQ